MTHDQNSKWLLNCTRGGLLTIHVVGSEGDLDAEGLVGVPDGGQREVGQGLLSEVGHHSL